MTNFIVNFLLQHHFACIINYYFTDMLCEEMDNIFFIHYCTFSKVTVIDLLLTIQFTMFF